MRETAWARNLRQYFCAALPSFSVTSQDNGPEIIDPGSLSRVSLSRPVARLQNSTGQFVVRVGSSLEPRFHNRTIKFTNFAGDDIRNAPRMMWLVPQVEEASDLRGERPTPTSLRLVTFSWPVATQLRHIRPLRDMVLQNEPLR